MIYKVRHLRNDGLKKQIESIVCFAMMWLQQQRAISRFKVYDGNHNEKYIPVQATVSMLKLDLRNPIDIKT